VEGIFRLAGSERRIKDLKTAFDSPDRYGKGLDWTGYTVHDAANILRRYFNQLPEPIIPLEFYQRFRDPLRNRSGQTGSQPLSPAETDAAIKIYQNLITELPPLNRQLLLYILDLLAVFASKSDMNKMTTQNLAAIFQPGILNHPQHEMAPQEYLLSQDILSFLIINQDSFLIGMQGTAADAETVREVQNGSPKPSGGSPTPSRAKTVIGRSSSNSSVAADSVRRFGSIRRNLSVSSRHSKRSEGASNPMTPTSPASAGGVQRSNTVPSRKGGSGAGSRLQRELPPPSPLLASASTADDDTPASSLATAAKHKENLSSDVQNTARVSPASRNFAASAPVEDVQSLGMASKTTPAIAARDFQTPKKDLSPAVGPQGGSGEKSSERSFSNTSSITPGRKFLDILKQSPSAEADARKPNKLQKKRMPGASLSSAQSSSQSLQDHLSEAAPRSPLSPRLAPGIHNNVVEEMPGEQSEYTTPLATPLATVLPSQPNEKPAKASSASPANSFHSQTDDTSDTDLVGDDMPPNDDSAAKDKKRSRWRFSRSSNRLASPSMPPTTLGTLNSRDNATSRSTIGSTVGSSATSQPRRSFQDQHAPISLGSAETPTNATSIVTTGSTSSGATTDVKASTATSQQYSDVAVFSDSEREKKPAGPMSWIRGKIQERKDKDAERRSRTPDRVGSSTSQIFQHERSKSRPDLQASQQYLPETTNADQAALVSATDLRVGDQRSASISKPLNAAQSTPPRPIVGSTWMAPPPLAPSATILPAPQLPTAASSEPAPAIVQAASLPQTTWMPVPNSLHNIPEVAATPPVAGDVANTPAGASSTTTKEES
jgi:hypothetical protein